MRARISHEHQSKSTTKKFSRQVIIYSSKINIINIKARNEQVNIDEESYVEA